MPTMKKGNHLTDTIVNASKISQLKDLVTRVGQYPN